ncbi:gamma-aminobutyrate:proton symporter (AAT family) [Scopulibacillus darangshiensis]|uniref:Gamma-aminobutyrate:proton symporter (AAT family) n=1 Tax=Scopulibacillus darangshiensis TaxID=442528 RepID=A0A4R2NJI9_9BACL|nr:amino acid permease [Scopulibacillus darangshiensis]TCP21502.1 gamma-aminobutyrate:proton symporter (AAT family) [Scopulibacillus darangshiensis]
MATRKSGLQQGLKTRHITMISIGGVIGSGLYVGTGTIINDTGPAAIISYLLATIMVVLVMRMLGEMAVLNPDSGSFSTYAQQSIGPWAGYTIGWLYWFNWIIIIVIESTILGAMVHGWVPSIPTWIASLCFPIIMMITNIFSVKSYGEFEYWLAFIKVATIIAFLCIGAAMILGIMPGVKSPGLTNFNSYGGFFPHGILPVFLSIVFITFSISGSEVAAIAAGESENPEKNIIKAINSVVWRLLIFFVGSSIIIVFLLPKSESGLFKAPYASIFNMAGLPIAGQFMNIVIFVSLLSILNTGMYTSSRILYSLSNKGDAPKPLSKVNKRGAPIAAILASVAAVYIITLLKLVVADKIFVILASSSGGVTMIMYIFIAVSHLRSRKKIERENPGLLKVKMWLFPYLTYVTIIMLFAIFVAQAFIPSMRLQFFLTFGITVLVLVSYFLLHRRRTKSNSVLYERRTDA